jgi:hypothetical protein
MPFARLQSFTRRFPAPLPWVFADCWRSSQSSTSDAPGAVVQFKLSIGFGAVVMPSLRKGNAVTSIPFPLLLA